MNENYGNQQYDFLDPDLQFKRNTNNIYINPLLYIF